MMSGACMEQLHISDRTTIHYKIEYSKRKSIRLKFMSDEELLIRAPNGFSKKAIEELLMEKADEIEKMYDRQKQIQKNQICYKPEQAVPFQDKWFPVKVITNCENRRGTVGLGEEGFVVCAPNSSVETVSYLLKCWYYKAAAEVLKTRTAHYAALMNLKYQRIVIKDQKTRWGSCSSLHNINYNWKLILMPTEILDYVVVHELAHLKEMNHSPRFWSEVEKILPSYKESRAWLRENGERYVWDITDNRSIN